MALNREKLIESLREATDIVKLRMAKLPELPARRVYVETGDLQPSVAMSPPRTAHRMPMTDGSHGYGRVMQHMAEARQAPLGSPQYFREMGMTKEQREDARVPAPTCAGFQEIREEVTWADVGVHRIPSSVEYTNEPEGAEPIIAWQTFYQDNPQQPWFEADSVAAYHRPTEIMDAQRQMFDAATMADNAYEDIDAVAFLKARRRLFEAFDRIPAEYRVPVVQDLTRMGSTAANWMSLPRRYTDRPEGTELLMATSREARRRARLVEPAERSELADALFAPAVAAVEEPAEV